MSSRRSCRHLWYFFRFRAFLGHRRSFARLLQGAAGRRCSTFGDGPTVALGAKKIDSRWLPDRSNDSEIHFNEISVDTNHLDLVLGGPCVGPFFFLSIILSFIHSLHISQSKSEDGGVELCVSTTSAVLLTVIVGGMVPPLANQEWFKEEDLDHDHHHAYVPIQQHWGYYPYLHGGCSCG